MQAGSTRLEEGVGKLERRGGLLLHQHLHKHEQTCDQQSGLVVMRTPNCHILGFKERVVHNCRLWNAEMESGIRKHLDIVSLPQVEF